MTIFMIKQQGLIAHVHASYDDLDKAVRDCIIHAKANDGGDTSWWLVGTERPLEVGQQVDVIT